MESYIRSHTALDQYELQGQVPETLISGQTADISPFVEFEWYDWIKIWDSEASFSHSKEVYSQWLGPSLDIGPAMTSKVLRQNGKVVYVSTYRGLTPEELNDNNVINTQNMFDKMI